MKTKAELIEENKRLNRLVKMYQKELNNIRNTKSYQFLMALKDEIREDMEKRLDEND